MAHTYEIEIKSLLGAEDKAHTLRSKLLNELGAEKVSIHSQLNHYFIVPEDVKVLEKAILPIIPEDRKEDLKKILEDGKNHSIRARDADGKVIFVIKASLGGDTSANGVSRIEFESEVAMSLEELDKILLDAGLTYQAKWSREREEYKAGGMNVTIDKNAGYGYLAEFEKVVEESKDVASVEEEIRTFMASCDAEELPQDRLERMFAHYNENWQDYYGTDKIFTIK
jgi:adenylate cyclase class IV